MASFVLVCPECGNADNLVDKGEIFHCTYCDNENELKDMDYETDD